MKELNQMGEPPETTVDVIDGNSKPEDESEFEGFIENQPNEYEVYQLRPECAVLKYMSLRWVLSHGYSVEASNYIRVYMGALQEHETLEDLFRKLNLDVKPQDYYGRSLSVSDIILLKRSDKATAHYCDRVGFVEVPEFLDSLNQQQRPAQGNAHSV